MGKDVDNLGESVQDAGGTAALPGAAVSPDPEVQPTSLDADDKLEAAYKDIDELKGVVRGLQGDRDRGANKAQRGVDELKEQFEGYEKYAKLKADGKSKDEAQQAMVLDEIVQERLGTQVVQETAGSRAVEPSGFNADEFLRGQGIDPNSAEALTLIRDGKTSITDYYNFALSEKTTPVQAPNPAQVMPVGTGGVATSPDVTELTARLKALQMEKSTPANLKERKQISEDLAKLTPRK